MASKPAKPRAKKAQLDELAFLQEEEVRITRGMALASLWDFITLVLWREEHEKHLQEDFHRPIADRITNAPVGCRDLLLAQRTSRKTYVRTIAHACWRIARDPNIRILVVSALDATAQKFVEIVKRQFQMNEGIKKYFPELHVAPRSKLGTQYEFTHPARDNINLVDPTLQSTYLGAPFAGRRCDIMIMDDPIDDKHVATPEQAEKALRQVNALFPIIDKNPVYDMLFVNGTRKSYSDVYAAMLGEDTGHETVAVGGTGFTCVVRAGLEDAQGKPDINGEPSFGKVLSRAVLVKELQRSQIDPELGESWFWREYQNVVMAPGHEKFLESWFDTWVPMLPPTVWSGIALDSAVKDKQIIGAGDYNVILLGHFDTYGNLFLTDGARSNQWRWADLIREMVGMSQRSGVFNVLKEKVGEGAVLGAIESEYHKLRLPCAIYPLPVAGEGKKAIRILHALQQPFQGRKIFFVGDGKGSGFPLALHKVIRDECSKLQMWSHDDAADALSLFFHRDIRIVPSSHRSREWKPFTHARLPQGSTPRFNVAAAAAATGGWRKERPAPQDAGDGSQRGYDPFVEELERARGGLAGDWGRPALPALPFPIGPGGDDVW